MATSMAKGRQAKRAAFDKASTLLRHGPRDSSAQQRKYTEQFAQAGGQPLGAVATTLAQQNLGGPQMPGQQTPLDIASKAADTRQQASYLANQQVRADQAALMKQAKQTVDQEMAERRARRARFLAVGASLALPAAGPVAGALGGMADKAAEGSLKRNLLGGAEQYLTDLQEMYRPDRRRGSGTGGSSDG